MKAALVAALLIVAPAVRTQQSCVCTSQSSSIAAAIGGGLFAGLIASVIPRAHRAHRLVGAVTAADSTPPAEVVALADSSVELVRAETALAPARPPRAARAPVSPLPSFTSSEAVTEGLVAPKTATFLPALAMIAVGVLLLGIFFLRVRQ